MLTRLSYYFIYDIDEKSIMHMHWVMRYGDPIYMSRLLPEFLYSGLLPTNLYGCTQVHLSEMVTKDSGTCSFQICEYAR